MGNFDSIFPVRVKGYAKNGDSRKCIDCLMSSDIARREQAFEYAVSTTPTIHKIPLIPPLPKGEIVIPLFGKEGRGEIS